VYEPNSLALYSLFTPEETAEITQRIEEAYRRWYMRSSEENMTRCCGVTTTCLICRPSRRR